jgi:hypothetical protein
MGELCRSMITGSFYVLVPRSPMVARPFRILSLGLIKGLSTATKSGYNNLVL